MDSTMSKGKAGRPSKFYDIDLEQVKALAEQGWTDTQMSNFFGVAESTWHLWKTKHKGFSESLGNWKEFADRRVERSLYEKATGYKCCEVKFATHEGAITDKIEFVRNHAPDTKAAIFWLKNRKPSTWRDKQEHDVMSSDGSMTPKGTTVINADMDESEAAKIFSEMVKGG